LLSGRRGAVPAAARRRRDEQGNACDHEHGKLETTAAAAAMHLARSIGRTGA